MKAGTIEIKGQVQGTTWSGHEAVKEFGLRFNTEKPAPFYAQWDGMRDALQGFTNDGDFQECKISWANIKVKYFISCHRHVVVTNDINRDGKLVSDLFCAEEDILYPELEY